MIYQKNCHSRDEHNFFHVDMHYRHSTSKNTFHKGLSILGERYAMFS